MSSSKRKSSATEGKRKTRVLDKTCTSINKSVSKKKSVTVENYGSYLQSYASHSVPVCTIPPSEHTNISASTGQAILTMLSQIDTCSKDLSRCMDQLEHKDSMSSTPVTSPTLNHCSSSVSALALLKAQICMTSFQTCTQIFGIHKALIHVMR